MATTKKEGPKAKVLDQKPTNSMSIAGFVCSFFVNILGLIFSIIGLNQIKTSEEKGRGLAIAGIVISSISIFFTILVSIGFFVFTFWAVDKSIDNGIIDNETIQEYIDEDVDVNYYLRSTH